MVWNSYQKVIAKNGAAGIDRESIEKFNEEMSGNLYKLWNGLYLHNAFDKWMAMENPQNPFERYADDIVMHCRSKEEAEDLLQRLKEQMGRYELTLHPEKTKIVYCKSDGRPKTHEHVSITFLSYTFQPRQCRRSATTKFFLGFTCAISNQAKTSIKAVIRAIFAGMNSGHTITMLAQILNPKIRGWINYYTKFARSRGLQVYDYLNIRIRRWIAKKYKLKYPKAINRKYESIVKENPKLFYHWQLGIK
jgi:RNA-directed DNA polymerase